MNIKNAALLLRRIFFALSLLLLTVQNVRADGVVRGYVLVRVEDSVNINSLLTALGLDNNGSIVIERIPNTSIYAVSLPWFDTEEDFAEQLRGIPGVRYAEADSYIGDPKSVPVDSIPPSSQLSISLVSDLLPLRASLTQIVNAGLAPAAYAGQPAYSQVQLGVSPTLSTGRGIKVAVLDTGVSPLHPTLYGHCIPGYNAVNESLLPLDAPDGTLNKILGHGTMIAGLIARIAPDADIVPVRVSNNDGIVTGLSAAKGVMFAKAQGARVLSLSFSSSVFSESLNEVLQSVQASGAVVVASAGNYDLGKTRYPAGMNGVIAVASVDSNGTRSAFSNYGKYIDVCAPGNGIIGANFNGGYITWSGTSFAVPFVAAQAALILERDGTLCPAQVLARIQNTARDISAANPKMDKKLGAGLITIEASLRATPRR